MSGQYNQQYGYNNGAYDYNTNQYQPQYQGQNSYPSEGFSGSYQQPYNNNSQPYYQDTRGSSYPDNSNYGQPNGNASYYNNNGQPNAQGPEADRGLLGAAAGGAAGAFGGHKVGHGFLGAVGGAILGSLTEDFAKGKGKHGKHNKRSDMSNASSGGLSSFFNKK